MGARLETLRRAAERRAGLPASGTTCYRVLQGAADGAPDVTVDRFEDVAVVSLYRELTASEEQSWVEDVAHVLGDINHQLDGAITCEPSCTG